MQNVLNISLLLDFMSVFFFNDTATTEIYTLSLHDALPISGAAHVLAAHVQVDVEHVFPRAAADRKSTRLNSSHLVISYAVFCLKKKKKMTTRITSTYLSFVDCTTALIIPHA